MADSTNDPPTNSDSTSNDNNTNTDTLASSPSFSSLHLDSAGSSSLPTTPLLDSTPAPVQPPLPPLTVPPPHSTNNTPRTSVSLPISPKTSKLLRRIQKREDELAELTLENEFLKEANRRSNEERLVREQERRLERKHQKEKDEKCEKELQELRQQLYDLTHDDTSERRHDPLECSRTIEQLSEMLQLREEQLELINLDRSKLYEEIETWKLGMEKLASLQAQQYGGEGGNGSGSGGVTMNQVGNNYNTKKAPSSSSTVNNTNSTSDLHLPLHPTPSPISSPLESKSDVEVVLNRLTSDGTLKPPPNNLIRQEEMESPIVTNHNNKIDDSDHVDGNSTATPFEPIVTESIYENQHRHPFFGFQPTSYPFMRHPFSDESGSVSRNFEAITLPVGWVWEGPWTLEIVKEGDIQEADEEGEDDNEKAKETKSSSSSASSSGGLDARFARLRKSMGLGSKSSASSSTSSSSLVNDQTPDVVGTDSDGWRYSIQYKLFAWHSSSGRLDTVRRRRWLRRRCFIGQAATEAMLQNALAAIAESGGAEALLAKEQAAIAAGTGDGVDGSVDSTDAGSDKPTLASLAAAYSSGASADSFSMFTSVAPEGVWSSSHAHGGQMNLTPGERALQALMKLGAAAAATGGQPTQTTATTTGNNTTTTTATNNNASAKTPSVVDVNPSSTPTPVDPASSSSSSSLGVGVIAGLSSYLSTTRMASLWSGSKKSTGVAVDASPPSDSNGQEMSVFDSPPSGSSSSAAPSPVCSFCDRPSKTALQYVHPSTSLLIPLVSFCHRHYHACMRHILVELESNHPNSAVATKRQVNGGVGVSGSTNVCEYCDALDTFPVQILHLKPIETHSESEQCVDGTTTTPSVSATISTISNSSPPVSHVLDVNDAYRFCATHMDHFIKIIQSFRSDDTPEPPQPQPEPEHPTESTSNRKDETNEEGVKTTKDLGEEQRTDDGPSTKDDKNDVENDLNSTIAPPTNPVASISSGEAGDVADAAPSSWSPPAPSAPPHEGDDDADGLPSTAVASSSVSSPSHRNPFSAQAAAPKLPSPMTPPLQTITPPQHNEEEVDL